MKIREFIKNNTIKAWDFLSVYSAFYKHHKSVCDRTDFKKISLTSYEKKSYRDYWKQVSPIISFKTVEIAKSLSGVFDKHIVPEEFYTLYIEPHLNDNKGITFFENKSIYNKWFNKGVFPKAFFHKFNNTYYSYDFHVIDDITKFIDEEIRDTDFPVVIKPNKGTFGGKDVNFVNSKAEIKEIIKRYPDLVVEEKIKQSEILNEFNKDSINTVRVSLYKDNNGGVNVLDINIRMGKDGGLDNEGSGGIACNIKSCGTLDAYAIDRYANKYLKHPNSGFIFAGQKLPLYEELIELSKDITRDVIGARIMGLDMVLDSTQKWRCIELSLFGLTTKPSQYSGKPFLGKYTNEIISNL